MTDQIEMCDLSVLVWLDELRFSIENYDQSVPSVENGVAENNWRATDEDEAIYERIWDCTTEFTKFRIRHAKVCRVSFDFDEMVENLDVLPEGVDEIGDETSSETPCEEDVMKWKLDLRFEYSSEEDHNDDQELLNQFDSIKRDNHSQQSVLLPFPTVDEDVEIRRHSPRRTPTSRSKTICAPTSRRTHFRSPIEEDTIEIRGVAKIAFPDGKSRKVTKGCCVRFDRRKMFLINEKDGTAEVLKDDVKIVSDSKTNKKEVELKDERGKTYKFHFDNSKDAKQYFDAGRERSDLFGEKATIRNMLLGLLRKRSSRDILEKKGIIKNEPIFGNTLIGLREKSRCDVPEFVTKTVELIERPDNVTSLGIYRASGNLATIQKIRFEVDRNNLMILDHHTSDVDVLTGALKMFFRELKEPLIPFQQYEQFLDILYTDKNKCDDNGRRHAKKIGQILDKLHPAHRETLKLLINHLLNVERHKDDNRMDLHNISVVWGPSLIWLPDQGLVSSVYSANNIKQQQENIIAHSTNAAKVLEMILTAAQTDTKNTHQDADIRKCYERDGDSPKGAIHNSNIEASLDGSSVPEFLTTLIKLIETDDNIRMADLYRNPGDRSAVDSILRKINKQKLNDLEKKHKNNGRELAWALKTLFAELERPLLPKGSIEKLVGSDANKVRLEIDRLRKETLTVLFKHLAKVAETNEMSKQEISNVWASVLFKPQPENLATYQKLARLLIEAHSFQEDNPNPYGDHVRGEATMLDENTKS